MKRWISIAGLSLVGVSLPGFAQQANQNINVLPVSDAASPNAELIGDLYLQRQVEPTIAVSTRNPDHVIAFFNDYRAVDIPDDPGLGETQNVAEKKGVLDRLLAWFRGRSEPAGQPELPKQVAAAEAWVGGSRSYDGGITWSGFFVPGATFDPAQASLDSPVYGLEAATDPVAAAAPCGRVEVVWLAFTRDGQSKMVISTYEDLNNDEGGDTWQYLRTTVAETGNNADNGYFLDKPFLIVDPKREEGAGCGYNVYASYTTFNGQESDGKFRSKVTFARSIDSGATYSSQKLNAPFHQNQGTWIAVDPRAGTPNTTGGGTIHLFWRHFFDPDTILTIDSTNFGATFPGQPKKLTGNENIATFDQPSLGIGSVFNPVTDLTFRSNGFPTATVTSEGVILVAWQEKVDITPGSPTFGQPDPLGSPRIVMMRSTNGGNSWDGFDPLGADAPRRAIDFGDRDQPGGSTLPADGFGALPLSRPSGPQVMPALSCGGGRCMLTYYESRGLLGPADTINPIDLSPTTGFISGLDRLLDLRATLLDPLTGTRLSTTQVSRYPIGVGADFSDGETLDDVDEVCSPAPELPGGVLCRRRVNAFGKPQSAAGTTPFGGDYTFLSPSLSLVPNLDPGITQDWRWATESTDVPYQSFRAVWADNRNLAAPTVPADVEEAYRYSSYGPPGLGGACVNAGSRNTDVLTARIDAQLIVTAPTTYKQLDARRGFPLSVSNGTDETKFYRLMITLGADSASFALDEALDVDFGDVEIFRYSSIAQVVYVDAGATGPIQITVTETDQQGNPLPGGQSGVVTFNPDPNNPAVQDLAAVETQDPFVINPFVINPFVINESLSNPFVINPFVINPFVINTTPGDPEYDPVYGVVDTTWTISAGETSTASSYLSLINIDNAEQYFDDYIFQLITYRTSGNGDFGTGGDPCASYNIPQDQIISSVYNDPANPFVINPFVINPFVINPFVINPFVINSTFTMAPADDSTSSFSGETRTLELDDGTTKEPRQPDEVKVTLRAVQMTANPVVEFRPDLDPPSYSIVSLPCNPEMTTDCIFSTAPDLLPVLGPDPLATGTVTVGQTIQFPANGWTLENLGRTDATADESETLRHGFYLSSFNPEGWLAAPENQGKTTTDMIAEPGFRSLDVYETSVSNTLVAGGTEGFGSSSLTIPTDLAGGEYYLVLFVDDLLEVSENDEVNNFELASFSIIVEVNTAPVATDFSFSIDEDEPYSGSLEADDDEGDDLTYVLEAPLAAKGEVTLDTDTGDFTYTPNADENGADSFGFSASDDEFESNVGTISVTIAAINDAPVATTGQTFIVPEDGSLEETLVAADADVGDVLTFEVVGSGPANGMLILLPNGDFIYTPNPDFAGTDTFDFRVCDQTGVCSTVSAQVSVSVQAGADPPVLALIGPKSVNEGGSLSFGVTATDPDIGDTLTLSEVGVPSFCSFIPTGSGTATIDCSADFTQSGIYSITVTVTDSGTSPQSDSETFALTVVEVNRAPVLAAIGSQGVDEDGDLVIALSATDVDAGDILTLGVAGMPSFCTFAALGSGTGSISCSPDFTTSGSYTMTVTVSDDGAPNLTDEETFTTTVNNVNQAPVLQAIVAQSVNEGATLGIALTASDPDTGSVLTFSLSNMPAFCTLTDSSGPSGTIECSPGFADSAAYSFTATVTDDGTPMRSASEAISLTVGEVNRAPVLTPIGLQAVNEAGNLVIALAATDVDAGDVLTLGVAGLPGFCVFTSSAPGTGSLSCSPGFTEAGTYPVTVTVTDNGAPNLWDNETFSLVVNNVNRAPIVIADAVDVDENGSVTFDPVFNSLGVAVADSPDFDPDVGDTVSLEGVTIDNPGNGGTVSSAGDLVTYVPGLNFVGVDTLTYAITDGSLESTGTITVTVLDGVPDWGFIGLQSPWKLRPIPRVNQGSSFPVRWQYSDPATGEVVDSADAMPEVRVKGPYDTCSSAGNGTELEVVLFPGNSDYQYDDRLSLHQLNWDTDGAVRGACYWIRVYSDRTWQINDQTVDGDLFVVKIK